MHVSIAAAPGRWRRRRVARITLAALLVVAAPVLDRFDPGAGSPRDGQVDSAPAPDRAASAGQPHGRGGGHDPDIRVVPVPLADPAVAALLQPGDLVDLVHAADPAAPAAAQVVARAARVRDSPPGRGGNHSILVEVPVADAARVAATAVGTPLAVLVHD